ncbi:MAG: Trp family transcriptional regulator [Patescibacteria group bacterium]
MPQVSQYPISKDVYQRVFDVFLRTIAGLRTKKEVSNFFEEFLTPTERIMFAKRLAIGLLLAKKYDYRGISKILRVSTTTVSSISILYRYGADFRKVIDNIVSDEAMEEFWLGLGEKMADILSTGGKGSGGWFYLKQQLRRRRFKKAF